MESAKEKLQKSLELDTTSSPLLYLRAPAVPVHYRKDPPDYILLGSQVVAPHAPSRPSQGPRGTLPVLSWVGEWVS